MSSQQLSLENRIAVVREYAALWQQFFAFFAEDLSEKHITQQDEQDFANITSMLALNHYKFRELVGEHFKDPEKVLDVLTEAVSLEHLQMAPEASFSKLQVEWHTLFIGMNKALGRLLSALPPKKLQELQQAREG